MSDPRLQALVEQYRAAKAHWERVLSERPTQHSDLEHLVEDMKAFERWSMRLHNAEARVADRTEKILRHVGAEPQETA